MSSPEQDKLFTKGLSALNSEDTLSALVLFEKASQIENNPVYVSYFAFCLARERGQYKKAISLCRDSMERDTGNPIHYLNLGRIHVLMGSKLEAIQIFREGLAYGGHNDLTMHLERLGARKKPVIPIFEKRQPCK